MAINPAAAFAMNPPHPSPQELFRQLLDESSALLGAPADAGVRFPDDDLHRDILLPLLPAMLGDESIRRHWQDQAATGFPARLARHLDHGEPAPRWQAADFEIHVTASYSAGPDARALADTLLSEDSLRDMTAALMNQILDALWSRLPLPALEVPSADAELPPMPPEEILPVPELSAAMARATPASPPPSLPAAAPGRRPGWRAIRGTRENPISGTRIWRGKIADPDWTASYPIAGGTAQP